MPNTDALILAFDTSAAHCAAALLSGDTLLGHLQEDMARGQAERIMTLCDELLSAHGKTLQDLDAIGVGIGPGNFTGIRISVSAARGLALGLGKPAIGVSTFDALRFGVNTPCACAVDAKRDNVYFQSFDGDKISGPILAHKSTLPKFDGPLIGHFGQAPAHPMTVAIAYIAAARRLAPQPRPAPLFIRPADAAPGRDTPPLILK